MEVSNRCLEWFAVTHRDSMTLTHHWGSETLSSRRAHCNTHTLRLKDFDASLRKRDFVLLGLQVTWLIHMCDMALSYVWHDSFLRVTWLIHTCGVLIPTCAMTHSYVWHDSFMCVPWLIPTSDTPHSCVWHDSSTCGTCSFLRVTCLIHMWDMLIHVCDMTHSYVWHASFICVTWLIYMRDMLIHMCDMPHSYVWHAHSYMWRDSFLCVACLIYVCDMTHVYVGHAHSYVCDVTRTIGERGHGRSCRLDI